MMVPRFALTLALLLSPGTLLAGPYPGAANSAGSEAIAMNDPRFVAWASGLTEVTYGADVDSQWRTPEKAFGPATDNVYDIVCLGNGGRITLHFPHPLRDGPGADFAVFENSFNHTFLELAFVEVSSDGVNFHRFPTASLTPSPVGGFGAVDPTQIDGLAGKYKGGFGTPFDLASLPDSPDLDKQRVRFVRLIDIIGDGTTKDSSGRPIYDPTPTIGSGGFDLNAIGAIHVNAGDFKMLDFTLSGTTAELEWESNPGSRYRIETSLELTQWTLVETVSARPALASTRHTVPVVAGPRRFWRVVRVDP